MYEQLYAQTFVLSAAGPANCNKRIEGIASTEAKDLQGEIVKQSGLDISALKAGLGLFNYDHEKGPENILGAIDDADLTDRGLKVKGYLFKHQPRAKAFYDIMRSLKPEQSKRVQMSIEGKIVKREGENGKVIGKAKVEKVALTVDPVNTETYTELVKSLSTVNATEEIKVEPKIEEVVVKKSLKERLAEVIEEFGFKKAISAGTGYTGSPTSMTNGSVLGCESLDNGLRDLTDLDDETKQIVIKMAKKMKEQFPDTSAYRILKSISNKLKDINLKGDSIL
jgi:hypothetical protein